MVLLTHRGQRASHARVGDSARLAAKAARDLLLHLEATQIELNLMVIAVDREVVEEGEHLILLDGEAFDQVAGRGLHAWCARARLPSEEPGCPP